MTTNGGGEGYRMSHAINECICDKLFIFKVSKIGKCFCRATRQKSHLHNKSREIIFKCIFRTVMGANRPAGIVTCAG